MNQLEQLIKPQLFDTQSPKSKYRRQGKDEQQPGSGSVEKLHSHSQRILYSATRE
jgi:hypothetical protein